MPYIHTATRDGETTSYTASDASALATLRRGQRYKATVEVSKDGTVTISRASFRFGERDGEVVERPLVITLNPTVKQPRLTKTQYEDLGRVTSAKGRARLENGRIRAAMWAIPAAVSKRLIERGLAVVSESTGAVVLGIAGMLAAAAYEHPVRTTTPLGWHYPEAGPTPGRMPSWKQHRRHPYQVTDYSSSAVCPCGLYAAHDRRDGARYAATRHIEENLTAALNGAS